MKSHVGSMPKTDQGIVFTYNYIVMHTVWKMEKKKRNKEQAQHPPSLHGKSDMPISWQEWEKMSLTHLTLKRKIKNKPSSLTLLETN